MSGVRTRAGAGAASRSRPPPPSFAPPSLPRSEQDVSVYIRADKIKVVNNDDQSDLSSNRQEEVNLNGNVTAPKVFVEESNITESINVTLGPRKSSKVDQVNSGKNVKDISNLASQHHLDTSSVSQVISPEITPHKNDSQEDNEEEGDLVPEIRNKCNDVKEILNRIMNKDDNLEDDEEVNPPNIDEPAIKLKTNSLHEEEKTRFTNNDDVTAIDSRSNIVHDKDEKVKMTLSKESHKEKGKISNLFEKHDLFEDIDNIADLTIDQVKNLLEEEEKTNAKLKTDLYNQKDENIERTRKISQAKLSPDRKVQTKRKSKKEMQLDKMKDFLKDPALGDDQEVNLDIRLKKTGGPLHFTADISNKLSIHFFADQEKERDSEDITQVTEGLYFANFSAVQKVTEKTNKYTVFAIGDLSGQMVKSKIIQLPLRPEQELSVSDFEEVARKMSEAVKDHGYVLVTSSDDTALAACLLIPLLVTRDMMEVGEAARHLERLRPGLCLPSHVIIKMEEWRRGSIRSQRSSMESSINSVSQSWLPLVFISIFLFLVLRAIFCFAGIDTHCVLAFINKVLRI